MQITKFMNGHALLIGVGADLPVTVTDATALREMLVAPDCAAYPPAQVELLTEASADRERILQALDRLIKSTENNPDATVIVYFSGHGGRIEYVDKPPEYFLVPYGYEPSQRNKTAISGQEFTEKIESLGSRKVIVLLDCCHAGGLPAVKVEGETFVKSSLPPDLIDKLDAGRGWIVVTSSRENEFSYTGNPYSVFTACLLEALRGSGAVKLDGYARILDVLIYLFAQVPERAGGRQHPFVKKLLDLGDNFPLCYYAGGSKHPPNGEATARQELRADYVSWKRHRLEQERESLRSEWNLRREKVQLFRRDLAIEAGTAIKFQLEKQLLTEEAYLAHMSEKLEDIERALGSP